MSVKRALKKLSESGMISTTSNNSSDTHCIIFDTACNKIDAPACNKNDTVNCNKIDTPAGNKTDTEAVTELIQIPYYKENIKENDKERERKTSSLTYEELVDEYGSDNVDLYVSKVREWYESNNKPLRDIYSVVRKWLVEDGVTIDKSDEYYHNKYDFVYNAF